jgi:hypothetical protein
MVSSHDGRGVVLVDIGAEKMLNTLRSRATHTAMLLDDKRRDMVAGLCVVQRDGPQLFS